MFKSEEWRDVVGYEGIYEVSSLGRVRSIGGSRCTKAGHILKFNYSCGYARVYLYRNGKYKQLRVHRLVLLTFVGKPSGGRNEVNHRNGDKMDNRLSNLEWVSPKENTQHAIRVLGCIHARKGEAHGSAKLTTDDVWEIKRLLAAGVAQRRIGRLFNVGHTTIWQIANGDNWKHIE